MRQVLLVVLAGLLLIVGVAPAAAQNREDIYADCEQDGRIDGSFTPSQLREARKNLPTDLREYSDCEDALRRAERPQPAPTTPPTTPTTPSTPPSSGGTAPTTPSTPQAPGAGEAPQATNQGGDAQAVIDTAKEAGKGPVSINKRTVIPAATGLPGGGGSNDLPGALVAALILLGVAGLALSVPPLRRKLPFLS